MGTRKWRTYVDYVDITTGEIIGKGKAVREYVISKEKPTYEFNEEFGIRRIIYRCSPSRQTRLF